MIIPPTWTLPEAIRIRLGQTTYGRQRAIFEDGHLLLVLHKAPGPDDSGREGVLFWRNPSGEWLWSRGTGGNTALKRHVQSYGELEGKHTTDYENATKIDTLFDLVDSLTPLTRAARNMHQALQVARESIKGDTFLIEVRDLAYEVERNLELLIEDVRNAIQHRSAREAEVQARLSAEAVRAGHRLNILAALFFPLTAISSVFGMNLAHGLRTDSIAMFWLIFIVGTVLGFGMKSWVLGKAVNNDSSNGQKSKT
jgi:hypothetical protein